MARRKQRSKIEAIRDAASAPMSDQPWYVRAVALIGVPSAIAVFLVYFLTNLFTTLATRLEAIEAGQNSHQKVMDTLLNHMRSDDEQMWQLVSINQRTCLNTAKTDGDKMACVIARGQK